MRRFRLSFALALSVACGNPPAQPSGFATLQIAGLTALQHPGDTAQPRATLTVADGSARDVTGEVAWFTTRPDVVNVAGQGLLVATGSGLARITGVHQLASAVGEVRIAPGGSYLIHGQVLEEGMAGAGVPGARVTVTQPGGGAVSASTDFRGSFILPARGEVTLRVEKAGYATSEKAITVERDLTMTIDVRQQDQPQGGLQGRHTLTLLVSPSCTLPADVSWRQYTADVSGSGWLVTVLSGADMVHDGSVPGFVGRRVADTVTFDIGSWDPWNGQSYSFMERLGPQKYMYLSGTATGTIGDSRTTATFRGLIAVYETGTPPRECTAGDHRLEFVRVAGSRVR